MIKRTPLLNDGRRCPWECPTLAINNKNLKQIKNVTSGGSDPPEREFV